MLMRGLALLRASTRASRGAGPLDRLRRLAVLLIFLPLIVLVQGMHWLGFALDELLFRDYRRIVVRKPVFVVGPPRSGTTFLHRLLAEDARLTTLTMWESLLAPSITERRLWMALGRFDRALGGHAARGLSRVMRRAFGSLESIHAMRFDAPEEDAFLLMPILACFILVIPFPRAGFAWRLGQFDREVSEEERTAIVAFYRRCVQKHLFVHGEDRQFVSKNPAFSAMVGALSGSFPDARFIACMRDPVEVVPSQLSAISGGLRFFGNDPHDPRFQARILSRLGYYYRNLLTVLPRLPEDRHAFVAMSACQRDLSGTVRGIYRRLAMPMTPAFAGRLERRALQERGFRSRHRYVPNDFGLTANRIRARYAYVYAIFDFEEGRLRVRPVSGSPPGESTALRRRTG